MPFDAFYILLAGLSAVREPACGAADEAGLRVLPRVVSILKRVSEQRSSE